MYSHTFIPVVLSLLSLVAGQDYGSCTNNAGASGSCINVDTCSLSGGSHEAGHCPGDTNIRCCTGIETGVGTSCTISGGASGTCKLTNSCSGTSTPGYCPGGADVQCCTTPSAPAAPTEEGVGTSCTIGSGSSGTCQVTTNCSGTSTPGFCPGPSNVQCCTTTSSSPSLGGGSGGGSLPGLNASQSVYARVIARHAPNNRGCIVGIATAMQESTMRVLANSGLPESKNYPHDGVGSDHDSVGLFQQRPKYWGTVKDCMDPETSSDKFFSALAGVSGWEGMSIAQAAQAVQRSAYPDAYAKWETLATNVCNSV